MILKEKNPNKSDLHCNNSMINRDKINILWRHCRIREYKLLRDPYECVYYKVQPVCMIEHVTCQADLIALIAANYFEPMTTTQFYFYKLDIEVY